MARIIKTLSDGSELVPYNRPDWPVYAGVSRLDPHAVTSLAYHWHDDIEFGLVTRGEMSYFINGETVAVSEGGGIFINARQMHSNSAAGSGACECICTLVHPSLLFGKYDFVDTAVKALVSNDAWAYQALSGDVSWQRLLISAVKSLHEAIITGESFSMLSVLSRSLSVVEILTENMPSETDSVPRADKRIPALRNMTGFIQTRYADKISLKDICAAGNVGTSVCYELFGKHFNMTPLQYLTLYRLNKAVERLKNRNLSIAEIAYSTGFSSASYFSECFKRQLSVTPTRYREELPIIR